MKSKLSPQEVHDLLSPVASIDAQIELLKRSEDYKNLSDNLKESLTRIKEKLLKLQETIKSI